MSEKPYKYVAEPDEKGFRMPEYIPEQSENTSQDSDSNNDTRQDQSPSATVSSAQQPTKPQYKAKVKTQALDIAQPETPLPAHVSEDAWHVEANKDGLSLGATTLGLGVFSLIGFFEDGDSREYFYNSDLLKPQIKFILKKCNCF